LATQPGLPILQQYQYLICNTTVLAFLSHHHRTEADLLRRAQHGEAVKVSLLFIVAATAAILIFYYKGLDLLSSRWGCFILSSLALNCILLTKRVKGIANQPNKPC
jgi:hypothetical protein